MFVIIELHYLITDINMTNFFQDLRYWCTMFCPVILYLLIGLIFKTNLVFVSKLFTVLTLCFVLLIFRRYLFTINLTLDFPLAVYLATKVSEACLRVDYFFFSHELCFRYVRLSFSFGSM